MNKNIVNAKKKFKKVLIFIITSLAISYLLFQLIFNKIISYENINQEKIKYINLIVLILFSILIALISIVFYKNKIKKLNDLLNTIPIKCVIEDFMVYIYGETRGKDRTYRIVPLVRDLETNELYITYDDYSLSYYKSIESRNNYSLINKTIFRKDRSPVNVGDNVYIYIRRKLNTNVFIDKANNVIKLNNEKKILWFTNNNFDIDILNKTTFFEGVIEVEEISNN